MTVLYWQFAELIGHLYVDQVGQTFSFICSCDYVLASLTENYIECSTNLELF